MKKITVLLLCLVAFVSCKEEPIFENPTYEGPSDEGVSGGEVSGDLEGTWKMVSYRTEVKSTAVFQGQEVTNTSTGVASNINAQVKFIAPDTYESSGSYDMETTFTANGHSFTQSTNISGIAGSGSWSKSGTDLQISSESQVIGYKITELTSTSLKMSGSQITEVEGVSASTTTVEVYERID